MVRARYRIRCSHLSFISSALTFFSIFLTFPMWYLIRLFLRIFLEAGFVHSHFCLVLSFGTSICVLELQLCSFFLQYCRILCRGVQLGLSFSVSKSENIASLIQRCINTRYTLKFI